MALSDDVEKDFREKKGLQTETMLMRLERLESKVDVQQLRIDKIEELRKLSEGRFSSEIAGLKEALNAVNERIDGIEENLVDLSQMIPKVDTITCECGWTGTKDELVHKGAEFWELLDEERYDCPNCGKMLLDREGKKIEPREKRA